MDINSIAKQNCQHMIKNNVRFVSTWVLTGSTLVLGPLMTGRMCRNPAA